jgi:hypothetical protein
MNCFRILLHVKPNEVPMTRSQTSSTTNINDKESSQQEVGH